MPRFISKKSARHLSILLPMFIATGCSQLSTKDQLTDNSGSKFSVFTRGGTGKLHLDKPNENKEYDTIWDRMLSLYALPDIEHPRIDREINFYLRNPEYLSRVQERAEPYLYFILNEIEAKKIPGELALLPVVESAFRPDAESPAQASGLWQFIPPTGRLYGLKQNSWYDGRRDIIESTQAATAFLKDLSENFNNDWLLALASYNAGKGNIQNAIERNYDRGMPTDFWSLSLNNETSAYVPRLLAIAKIFANPEKYNLNLYRIPNEPYFELVDIKSQLDLAKAAEMADTSVEHLFRLNPGFNRWSTDPEGPHRLLIPVGKAHSFKTKLAELPHHERIKWQHHTVGKRETLKSIAKHYHADMEQIAEVNHLNDYLIETGQVLLIPASYQSIRAEAATANATASSANDGNATARHNQPAGNLKQTITVKKGDTLSDISLRNGVDTEDLIAWNHLRGGHIKAGQKLLIKKGGDDIRVASTEPAFKQISYTVKSGDTLGGLAKKFNVDVTELRKWNNVPKNRADLKPGVKLKLIVESNSASAS